MDLHVGASPCTKASARTISRTLSSSSSPFCASHAWFVGDLRRLRAHRDLLLALAAGDLGKDELNRFIRGARALAPASRRRCPSCPAKRGDARRRPHPHRRRVARHRAGRGYFAVDLRVARQDRRDESGKIGAPSARAPTFGRTPAGGGLRGGARAAPSSAAAIVAELRQTRSTTRRWPTRAPCQNLRKRRARGVDAAKARHVTVEVRAAAPTRSRFTS